ncbi:CNH domain [Trypanosoma vivax]|nr:CNH domain [Trypanosoma vivax]
MASCEAFQVTELLGSISYTVECIATSGNLLFVGTKDGKIIVYEVSHASREAQCVHIHTSRHRKPIRLIVPISEKHILLALCGDVTIAVHRLEEMDHTQLDRLPENHLEETGNVKELKDIIAFHVKRHKGAFVMAVLQKRKVSILEYNSQSEQFVLTKGGLLLPDGARSVLWAGRNIIVTFRREYLLMDVATGTTERLLQSSKKELPSLLLSLDPVPEVLMCDENETGRRTLRDGSMLQNGDSGGITWPSSPNCFTFVYPFVLTTHEGGNMEVRLPFLMSTEGSVDFSCSFAQNNTLKNITHISQRPYADFDLRTPTRGTHTDALRRDIVIAVGNEGNSNHNNNVIYLIELAPLGEQVDTLVSAGQLEASVVLSQLCANEVSEFTATNVQIQFALWCFMEKKDYRASMAQFREAKVDPRLVISLFPGFLSRQVAEVWRPPHYLEESLLPGTSKGFTNPEEEGEAVAAFLCYALPLHQEYLAGYYRALAENSHGNSAPSDANCPSSVVSELHSTVEAIDTAIMKAYMIAGKEEELHVFLSGPNACALPDAEAFLMEKKQWVSLVTLWLSRGLHSRSLELLHALATGSVSPGMSEEVSGGSDAELLHLLQALLPELLESNTRTKEAPLTSQSVIAQYLEAAECGRKGPQYDDSASGRLPSAKVLLRCIGVVTAIQYINLLPWNERETFSLVERSGRWVLDHVPPRWSVKMFPVERMELSQRLLVLHLMSSDLPDATPINAPYSLPSPSERVVEWFSLVFGKDCNACPDTEAHNTYLESLVQILFSRPEPGGYQNNEENVRAGAGATSGDSERQRQHQKLLRDLLCDSQYIDMEVARTFFEQPHIRTRAFTERAVVYKRLKLHAEAIHMFLYEVESLEEAMGYAKCVSRDGDDAFSTLLSELLNPSKDAKDRAPRLHDAIEVMNKCEGINPLTALPLLPDHTPIAAIESFMKRSLTLAAARNRTATIYSRVLESRLHQAERALAREESRYVVMDLGACCSVCGKKLRPGALLARFPNGVLCHQPCVENESVCPVSRVDFRHSLDAAARRMI